MAAPCHRQGFFRSHDLLILDEPAAVIVTHRLGSVKLAARILVMKDGEAVQTGTHEELIAGTGSTKGSARHRGRQGRRYRKIWLIFPKYAIL
nr:hypothetical protein [uncultured Acetatifactor sp.]